MKTLESTMTSGDQGLSVNLNRSCSQCGASIKSDTNFCNVCGASLQKSLLSSHSVGQQPSESRAENAPGPAFFISLTVIITLAGAYVIAYFASKTTPTVLANVHAWLVQPLSPLVSYVLVVALAIAAWVLVIVPLWRCCLLPQNKLLRRSFVAVGIALFVFALGLWVGWHKDAIGAWFHHSVATDDATIKKWVNDAIKRGEEWGKESESVGSTPTPSPHQVADTATIKKWVDDAIERGDQWGKESENH